MLSHYLAAGIRTLTKSWTYTFINIFGLAIGLAASLLILIYVRYELTYDRWIPDSERVYQLQTVLADGPGGGESLSQFTAYAAGVALKKDFPQIDSLVHAQRAEVTVLQAGQRRSLDGLLMVDGPFLDIIGLPLVEGDSATALAEPGSLVLTLSEARRLFGSRPAIGQVLTFTTHESLIDFGYRQATYDYRVTGVIKDLPKNTHLDFKALARFDAARTPAFLGPVDLAAAGDWGGVMDLTYLKLHAGADVRAIRAAVPAWRKRNVPPEQLKFSKDWRIANVRDIHTSDASGSRPNADKGFITTFAVIAFLILAMACINFTNLATARASRRAREVALRKLLGASRRQLVAQFLLEALLFTAIAMVVALTMVELLLPRLSGFLDVDLSLDYGDLGGVLLPIAGLILVVGLAGGLYPALYLSRFMPARILKANASVSEAPGSGRLRTVLVVAQFAISIGLIVCTAVVYDQTVFARAIDPGFRRSGLLEITNMGELGRSAESFAREVASVPGVRSVSRSIVSVGFGPGVRTELREPGMTEALQVLAGSTDPAFFRTFGIRLLAGRTFDERRGEDDATVPVKPDPARHAELAARSTNVIINERAVRALGFGSPDAAIGKMLHSGFGYGPSRTSTVIGVVQDSRFGSVRQKVEPTVYFFDRNQLWYLAVRFEGANPAVIRNAVEKLWRRRAPYVPARIEFADDTLESLYRPEETRGAVFAAFAILAVVIACLGLYGLAAFTAERRTKEIGIRKVLGARVRDIVKLLVWQFSRPVLIANLIAWPVAWWAMRNWLNGFDARIPLTPAPFVLAGLLALAIAIVTIAAHAVTMARANPIHALRYE